MANSNFLTDASFIKSVTMPGGASTTVNSAVLDLGAEAYKPGNIELVFKTPALSATMVPDTKTVTYSIADSTSSTFATTRATLFSKTITASGTDGVAAQTIAIRLPPDCSRYVRASAVSGANTTDMSAVSAEFSARF